MLSGVNNYEYPGGLYIDDVLSLTILSTNFSRMKGKDGGALYATISDQYKLLNSDSL